MELEMNVGRTVDRTLGFFSQYLHRPSVPHPDTLAHLESYFGLSVEEMFPAPPEHPRLRSRWLLPHMGARRKSLVGTSAHEPLSEHYKLRHATEYSANQTLRARLIAPLERRSDDLFIYVHGWMAPGALGEELTLMPWFTRRFGADIVHLDLPFHAGRRPRFSLVHGSYYWTADLVRTIEAVRQSVIDVRTLVRWGRTEGYRRVGVAGVSLGGVVTMMTACAEADLDWACPLVAHLDLKAAVEDAPILAPMKRDLESFNISLEQLGELIDRVGFVHYPLAMERERMLIVAARDDAFLEARHVEQQWQRWGRPPIHWISGGHMMIVPNMPGVWKRMADFIEPLPPLHPRAGSDP